MSFSEHPLLPAELMNHIAYHCTPSSLKCLATVSKGWCQSARTYLFRNVYQRRLPSTSTAKFEKDPQSAGRAHPATEIKDSVALYRLLLSVPEIIRAIRTVYLHHVDDFEQSDSRTLIALANLLSQSEQLDVLSLSFTTGSDVALQLDRLDNVEVEMYHRGSRIYETDFTSLIKYFKIKTARNIHLINMPCLNCEVPTEYQLMGVSNISHLALTNCGWVRPEFRHVLQWPAKLETLHIYVAFPDWFNRHVEEAGEPSYDVLFEALAPLEESLIELEYFVNRTGARQPPRAEGKAFKNFRQLKALDVDLGVLMEFSDEEWLEPFRPFEITAPPIQDRLPSSLERLAIVMEWDFLWYLVLDEPPSYESSEMTYMVMNPQAEELLSWLSGLAIHKRSKFPHLRRVVIHSEKSPSPPDEWDITIVSSLNSSTLEKQLDALHRLFEDAGVEIMFQLE
ncbi:MAG: hypothetical protein M1820_005998 [Bogoriella megaspora]|nr:MAG: hypothetical protein M1820_005998 [Bogoriella megaspora]